MKENSEMLAQQAKSAGAQVGSGPTVELVTERGNLRSQCNPTCPPCPPWRPCEPVIFKPPCHPDVGLPRPPIGPPRPN